MGRAELKKKVTEIIKPDLQMIKLVHSTINVVSNQKCDKLGVNNSSFAYKDKTLICGKKKKQYIIKTHIVTVWNLVNALLFLFFTL